MKPVRGYGLLLRLLGGREPREQNAIKRDAELLLDAARANGP